jgi:outer membrane protein OmpA-like peptidoglycan-associated protein
MGRLKVVPLSIAAAVIFGGGGLIYAVQKGLIAPSSAGPSVVPVAAPLPTLEGTSAPAAAVPLRAMPSTAKAAMTGPEVRLQEMAWNSQTALNYANGGIYPTEGSLMQQHGVNLHIVWEDDVNKQMTALINFAAALKKNPQPTEGAHFAALMGDGSAAMIGGILKDLRSAGADPEVVGSAGYSRGEDQLMGPPTWFTVDTSGQKKLDPNQIRGALISGFLRDGDWNIALKLAGDLGIPNNPDEKTWDPTAINWYSADDYIKAADAYIDGICEERPVVVSGKRTGDKKRICINAVVTWTPGDVNVAEKKGGLTTIVSTKTYRSQMPNTIIGIKQWDQANKATVVEMLAAMFEGADQVKSYEAALRRGCEANSIIWSAPDGGGRQTPDYWMTYFKGVTKPDKQGVTVDLGGSSVNNLQDNLILYGLTGGGNYFASTYTLFSNIVRQQYPKLVPEMLPVEKVLNTEYVLAVKQKYGQQAAAPADVPKLNTNVATTKEVGKRSWNINFDTGKATFRSDTIPAMFELFNGVQVGNQTLIEVIGHTDNTGDPENNRVLSKARAEAVKAWLVAHGTDADRFVKIDGVGSDKQVATDETETGRAKNRRVEIILKE